MTRIVLASTSPYRAELLSRLGVPFEIVAPDCDEEPYHATARDPSHLARELAEAKARSVQTRFDDETILIGSDQVAALQDGTILTKPGNHERALAQLSSLQGRTHELITALCLVRGTSTFHHLDRTRLLMRPLSPEQIERYLHADRPYDCVGCYKLESRGIALFEAIETRDHTAITGLPLMALTECLVRWNVSVP